MRQTEAPPSPDGESKPAAPATLENAIEQVSNIIGTLRETLDDMEGVLEMLEEVERQSSADDREIESLQRALRQLQRPRDGGPPQQRRHAPE